MECDGILLGMGNPLLDISAVVDEQFLKKLVGWSVSAARIMGSSEQRCILTSFSPSLDYFAITTGDSRIKIWDTIKDELKLEFTAVDEINSCSVAERAHVSFDYTCMKWISAERMRKKSRQSLLLLGTASGDVLAWDISSGQLKWRNSDLHPGGVSAITFYIQEALVYTSGVDGVISKIDSTSGNLLGRFRALAKPISSISISPDGKLLATASGEVKIFNCSDQRRIQKFYGHPGAVRCMSFTENGKFVLSSAVGERYVAVWRVDCSSSANQAASCVLAMEHPAVTVDSKCTSEDGLCILAVSERGVCYIWQGQSLEQVRNAKPTKITSLLPKGKGFLSAKLDGFMLNTCDVFVAYGLAVKPLFQKLIVHIGNDINLKSFIEGILLPSQDHHHHLCKTTRIDDKPAAVTALDRSNAGDSLLPIPKIYGLTKKRKIVVEAGMSG